MYWGGEDAGGDPQVPPAGLQVGTELLTPSARIRFLPPRPLSLCTWWQETDTSARLERRQQGRLRVTAPHHCFWLHRQPLTQVVTQSGRGQPLLGSLFRGLWAPGRQVSPPRCLRSRVFPRASHWLPWQRACSCATGLGCFKRNPRSEF